MEDVSAKLVFSVRSLFVQELVSVTRVSDMISPASLSTITESLLSLVSFTDKMGL